MVELELLGANGDTVVMTDAEGERYSIVIDDALRAAVRRDRAAVSPQLGPLAAVGGAGGTGSSPLRPRQLQALMRAGATAAEVAASTGMKVDHVRRFEGPVLAERQWAVSQAQACRIGWEKDSPLLGELVVDRLATRGVDPSCLEWDALREGREPWLILVTFIQAAEEKQARWTLDLTSRAVHALDDEARWLTEAASAGRRPVVFDQDSAAQGARSAQAAPSAHSAHSAYSAPAGSPAPAASAVSAASAASTPGPAPGSAGSPAPAPPPAFHEAPALEIPTLAASAQDSTDALLADLASNRGRRMEVELPLDDDALPPIPGSAPAAGGTGQAHGAGDQGGVATPTGAPASAGHEPEATTQTSGIRAQVYSMSERRRRSSSNHPAGSRLGGQEGAAHGPGGLPPSAVPTASAGIPRQGMQAPPHPPAGPSAESAAPAGAPAAAPAAGPAAGPATEPATEPVPQVPASRRGRAVPGQEPLPQMPAAPTPKPKRRSARRTMPSWDDIVFGAKPE
ncbi:septation protein SepH [Actinomyces bowdenii]|nr:septation protein SepH [Actinomyces bowdenii]MCR2051888.1 septation protein SepH [Actinomyces bowdenii]MDO5064975.1 septation protein SepH [Actinomyces bowdenii]